MRAEKKQQRWESSGSVFHENSRESSGENYRLENSFGTLEYLTPEKKGEKQGNRRRERRGGEKEETREGFVLEAKEAPGTPAHTEKEKRLDTETMKQVRIRNEKHLYASEIPLRSQAVFYDISEWRRSDDFLECMKQLMAQTGHRTLEDMMGFLDQSAERQMLDQLLEERRGNLTMEEFGNLNRMSDILNERLHKKERKEEELCSRLQLMIDRREEGENRRQVYDRRIAAGPEEAKKSADPDSSEENNEENVEKSKKLP